MSAIARSIKVVVTGKKAEQKIYWRHSGYPGGIKGESYERDTMYPDFIKQAKADEAKEATRTFLYAEKAEAEHAKLYQQTLDNLGQKQDAPIYVCKVCGYTTTKLPERNCPSCREPVSEYEKIN